MMDADLFVIDPYEVYPVYALIRVEPCKDAESPWPYQYIDSEGYDACANESDLVDVSPKFREEYIKAKEAWDIVQHKLHMIRLTKYPKG